MRRRAFMGAAIGGALGAGAVGAGALAAGAEKAKVVVRNQVFRCSKCGKSMITVAQRDWLVERKGLSADYFNQCEACKRPELAQRFATVGK